MSKKSCSLQQHAGAGVVDVEEALQVGEGVGRAQRLDAGVGQRHAVALRQREDQLGLERALDVDVQLGLGHARAAARAGASAGWRRSRWCSWVRSSADAEGDAAVEQVAAVGGRAAVGRRSALRRRDDRARQALGRCDSSTGWSCVKMVCWKARSSSSLAVVVGDGHGGTRRGCISGVDRADEQRDRVAPEPSCCCGSLVQHGGVGRGHLVAVVDPAAFGGTGGCSAAARRGSRSPRSRVAVLCTR